MQNPYTKQSQINVWTLNNVSLHFTQNTHLQRPA